MVPLGSCGMPAMLQWIGPCVCTASQGEGAVQYIVEGCVITLGCNATECVEMCSDVGFWCSRVYGGAQCCRA